MAYVNQYQYGQDNEEEPSQYSQSGYGGTGSGITGANPSSGYSTSNQANDLKQSNNQGRLPEGFVNMNRYVDANKDDVLGGIDKEYQKGEDLLTQAKQDPNNIAQSQNMSFDKSYSPEALNKLIGLIESGDPSSSSEISSVLNPDASVINPRHVGTNLPSQIKDTSSNIWNPDTESTGSEGAYYYGKHINPNNQSAYAAGNQNLDNALFNASGGRQEAKSLSNKLGQDADSFVAGQNTINSNLDATANRAKTNASDMKKKLTDILIEQAKKVPQSYVNDTSFGNLAKLVGYNNPLPYRAETDQEKVDDAINELKLRRSRVGEGDNGRMHGDRGDDDEWMSAHGKNQWNN